MSGRRRQSSSAHGVDEIRQRISREAARLIAEEGINDFHVAKRKAIDRLCLPEGQHLPSNPEIEQALAQHLQLFHARELPQTLSRLRRLAVQTMRLLQRFDPRLVGSLVTGHVTRFSEIQLHVTTDAPELFAFFLQEHGIPYVETNKRLRFGGNRSEVLPIYRFLTDDVPVEIYLFSTTAAREAPLSPVDGRSMKRMPLIEVEALVL